MAAEMTPKVPRLKLKSPLSGAIESILRICCGVSGISLPIDYDSDGDEHEVPNHIRNETRLLPSHCGASTSRCSDDSDDDIDNIRSEPDHYPMLARMAYQKSTDPINERIPARDFHCSISEGGCGMTYWYRESEIKPIRQHVTDNKRIIIDKSTFKRIAVGSKEITVGLTVKCLCGNEISISEGSLRLVRVTPEKKDLGETLRFVENSREFYMGEKKRLDEVDCNSLDMNGERRKYFLHKLVCKRIVYFDQKECELTGIMQKMCFKMEKKGEESG